MELVGPVEALSDAACEVWDAVAAGGWSPTAVTDTLGAVDVLAAALARLGPDAEQALAPVLAATARLRTIVTTPADSEDRHTPSRATGRSRAPTAQRRRDDPQWWAGRDMRVAEELWCDAQEGAGGRLAELFAALPPKAMTEALDRRQRGERWPQVLDDLTRRTGS